MSEYIKDGKGRGFLAEVNKNHKLMIDSSIQTKEMELAIDGESFIISSKVLSINSTNPHLFLYIKNTNPQKNLYIWNVAFSWNGGTTNHNRTMKWGWVVGLNEPTTNFTPIAPLNLNLTSGNVAEAVSYIWDGVGDGMTYTGGEIIMEESLSQGLSVIETKGIPIMGLNNSVGVIITGEEIGNASATIRGYYI